MTFVSLPSFPDVATGAGAWSLPAMLEFWPILIWPIAGAFIAMLCVWILTHLTEIMHFFHHSVTKKVSPEKNKNEIRDELYRNYVEAQTIISMDNVGRSGNRLKKLLGIGRNHEKI